MKKKCFVWIVLLLCNIGMTKAQVVKIENGVAITSLNIGKSGYAGTFYPYQMSIGLDYMDRGWYELSSSIGYLRKGSKEDIVFSGPEVGSSIPVSLRYAFDYITLNTTFRVKATTYNDFTFYAGAGPRVDIKVNDGLKASIDGVNVPEEIKIDTRSFILGLKTEVGTYYSFNRCQLGVNFAYLPSFIKPVKGGLKERTFTVGLTVGYVL